MKSVNCPRNCKLGRHKSVTTVHRVWEGIYDRMMSKSGDLPIFVSHSIFRGKVLEEVCNK